MFAMNRTWQLYTLAACSRDRHVRVEIEGVGDTQRMARVSEPSIATPQVDERGANGSGSSESATA